MANNVILICYLPITNKKKSCSYPSSPVGCAVYAVRMDWSMKSGIFFHQNQILVKNYKYNKYLI